MADEERRRRVAANESRFRDINDELDSGLEEVLDEDATIDFVCECARPECRSTIVLSRADYAKVRESPVRFMVAPGHELGDVERIVEEHPDRRIVEKLGAGAEAARRHG